MDMIQGAAIMRFDFSYRGCLLLADIVAKVFLHW
jgi:hypothetical protein